MAWDALIEALSITFTIPVLGGVLAGLVLGLVFGAIPGLTATLGIVLLLPFVWAMSPFVAFAIMLSLVSAVHTSNTFPAFFFNVPGSPSAAATILDGYPMAKNGDAAKGLTAGVYRFSNWRNYWGPNIVFSSPFVRTNCTCFCCSRTFYVGSFRDYHDQLTKRWKTRQRPACRSVWIVAWICRARPATGNSKIHI